MQLSQIAGEKERVQILHDYRIMDTPPERDYQDIVNMAASICEVPISVISFVDENRQWFKSKVGLSMNETPRTESFCAYTIEKEEILVVSDAIKDARFRNLPFVQGPPYIRFYAGAPLITDEGYVLGALCVMDHQPGNLSLNQIHSLSVLARQIIKLLELRRSNSLLEEQNNFLSNNNSELYRLNLQLNKSEQEIRQHLQQINELQTVLAAHEQQYRELVESATDLMYELDAHGKFTFVNNVMEKEVGFTKAELADKTYWELIHPDFHTLVAGYYSDQRKRRIETSYLEFVMLTKQKTKVWIGQNVRMFYDENGRVYKVSAISRNITSLKNTELRLADSERRFRLLSENAPVGIFQTDANGRCQFVNKRWSEISGFSSEQASGNGWTEAIHPDDRPHVFAEWMKAIFDSREFVMEFRFSNHGDTRWVSSHSIQIIGTDGSIEGYIGTINDITELKSVHQKLQEREELYRLVSTNSNDMITLFSMDEPPVRKFISPSVIEILGYSPEELLGKIPFDLIHEDDVAEVRATTATVRRTARPATVEYRSRRKDGRYIWLETKLNPFFDTHGNMIGFQAAAREVTQRVESENLLREEKSKAEEATLAKSQFLSMMSHEIRTPMNAILGLTQIMMQENPREDQRENLQLLKFSGENLLTIINDILDFSKIEAGKIELEYVNLDLHELMSSTLHMLDHRAKQKNIDLILSLDESLPRVVKGDPVRLSQIVNNLVGNAIKFTNEGYVRLEVRLQDNDDATYRIEFSVEDTGIGIAEEKLNSVFERFSQADSDTTRKFGGTGLGLSITKNLVKLMGGDIDVKSQPGQGSTFSFTLNLEEGTEETESVKKVQVIEDFTGDNIHVLLVEDNQINQIVAGNFLESWGLHVDVAENGLIAVEKIRSMKYDLVLMDIQMPEVDGYEATTSIRQLDNDYFQQVPIIALTASAMLGMRDKVITAGMNDFITKPFIPEELNAKITRYVIVNPLKKKISSDCA